MKNKISKILFTGLFSIASAAVCIHPVVAAENTGNLTDNAEKVTDIAPELNPSTIIINAYNSDSGQNMSQVNFEIEDRLGNLISFSKISTSEYEADPDGRYKYIELVGGSVEVKGLNGSYVIKNATPDGDVMCNTPEQTISISPEERKTVSFDYGVSYGTLRVTFVGEDESAVSNAKFTVKNANGGTVYFAENGGTYEFNNNSAMSELSTNGAGVAVLRLPGGSYTITQTSAPAEYNGELASKAVYVGNQEDVGVSLINKKKYGDLIVSVTDSVDNTIGLSGAEFTVTASNGEIVYVSNDGNGIFSFTRSGGENTITSLEGTVSLNGLPEGAYTIKQVKGADGYEISDVKQFDIKSEHTTDISFRNDRSVGTIRISVKDEESGTPVEGHEFYISTVDSEEPLKFVKTESGYSYNENGNASIKTDSNGIAEISGVPTAEYYVGQVSAAAGYLLDTNDSKVSVIPNGTTEFEVNTEKSNSSLYVVDKDGRGISGAGVEILDSNGIKVLEGITGDNGKYVIGGLPEGEYKLSIISVPETYAKYKKSMTFTLDNTGMAEGLARITLESTEASLNIGKPDIEVVLTNKADNSIVTAKSDEEGIATFEGLAYGDYVITLSDSSISFMPIEFSVNEDFGTVSYSVELIANSDGEEGPSSSSSPNEGEVQKKTSNTFIMFLIAAVVGAAGGAYSYIALKKKKKANMEAEPDDTVKVGFDKDGNAVLYEEVEVEIPSPEESEDYGLVAGESDNIDADADSVHENGSEG